MVVEVVDWLNERTKLEHPKVHVLAKRPVLSSSLQVHFDLNSIPIQSQSTSTPSTPQQHSNPPKTHAQNVRRRYTSPLSPSPTTSTSPSTDMNETGPPEPTPEELRRQEELAAQTLYGAGVMCVVLYICTYTWQAGTQWSVVSCEGEMADQRAAPFIVDYVTKLV